MATVEDLRQIVSRMVDHPEMVEVRESAGGDRLELRVAPDDLGQVIGKQGRTARALRALLAARRARQGGPDELKILED